MSARKQGISWALKLSLAKEIRRAKDLNSERLFAAEEFLSSQQIALLCSSQDWLQKAGQSAVASYVQSTNDEKKNFANVRETSTVLTALHACCSLSCL